MCNPDPNYGRTPGKTRLPEWAAVGRQVRTIRANKLYTVKAPDYMGIVVVTDADGIELRIHLSEFNPNGVPTNAR